MRQLVTNREAFKNHNKTVYAEDRGSIYVVYSYGSHFPMYVYDNERREWYGNEDKYSSTTSRHQSHARPDATVAAYVPTSVLRDIVDYGGYAEFCAHRCRGWDRID